MARRREIAYLTIEPEWRTDPAAPMPESRLPQRPLSRTPFDPEGYYARLGVEPSSGQDAIAAAWRREARLVHPDVPETGDAAAFLELKEAYDVLSHPLRRSAYDRSARRTSAGDPASDGAGLGPGGFARPAPGGSRAGATGFGGLHEVPLSETTTPLTRHPRLRDLPTAVWAGMAIVLLIGVIEVGLHLTSAPTGEQRETITATAPDVPPLAPNDAARLPFGPAPLRLAGTPNFYIVPTASAAMLWKVDEAKHLLVPWGQLPAFSAVQALRLLKPSGMVEVKVTDTANGYVDAVRLTPGDSAAAARAWCTYNAGPTPGNGEVLSRAAKGNETLSIDNRSGQLAVVKLRSATGAVVASVFVDPGGEATLDGLPDQPLEIDFATGEIWSRACRGFVAGMRASRLPGLVSIGTAPRLAIPPDAAVETADISDQAFERE